MTAPTKKMSERLLAWWRNFITELRGPPQAERLELRDPPLIAPFAAPVPPGKLRIPGIAERQPMVARQFTLEKSPAAVEQKEIVPADLGGIVEVDDGDRYIVKQMDEAPGENSEQAERRADVPVAQCREDRARMPRRIERGVDDEQVELAAAQLDQASDQASRAEGTVNPSPRLDAGPIVFGLLRHGQDEQFVRADFEDAKRTCAGRGTLGEVHVIASDPAAIVEGSAARRAQVAPDAMTG